MQSLIEQDVNFWGWFFQCKDNKSGYSCIINKWMLKHLLIGSILLRIIPLGLKEVSTTVLFPLVGIFVGISCAWIGSAYNLLQSSEFGLIANQREGGLRHYIFVYQTSVLVIILALIAWGIAGLGVIEYVCPETLSPECYIYITIKWFLYSLLSLAINECWSAVFGTQLMLLYRANVKLLLENKDKSKDSTHEGSSHKN